jgi:hypothetical protein
MRNIFFTVPFYHAYGAQPFCLLGCYTTGLQSWRSLLCNLHLPHMISHHLPTSFPTADRKEGTEK